MKGIKECLGWLVDNPGKQLSAICGCEVRRKYIDGSFMESTSFDWNEESYVTDFSAFRDLEWEEVKTPYTFEEAYKLCKEEGVEFESTNEDRLWKDEEGGIRCQDKDDEWCPVYLNCDWFRK